MTTDTGADDMVEAVAQRIMRDVKGLAFPADTDAADRAEAAAARALIDLVAPMSAQPDMSTGSKDRQDVSTFDAFFDASAPPDGDGV